tara:strand:+ start:681 stop:1265 length:585 start_codon:yes stop_codon:yes gene_type:complete
MAKYWLAGNPNAEITNAEVKELATISETDFGVVSDLTVSANELNRGTAIFTSVTALTAGGALSANTLYHVNDTDTGSYTLPAAASSTIGDRIELIYKAAVANGEVHKYGTSGEFLADTSYVLIPSNAANAQVYTSDHADGTGDDFLNLTGASNAGWGIGTKLVFVFNGSKWHVECVGTSQGTGAVAATAEFATS